MESSLNGMSLWQKASRSPWMPLALRLVANGAVEVRAVEPEALRHTDEPIDLIGEVGATPRARRRPPGRHGGADAWTRLEQPALDERREDLLRGVRVDLQLLTERADGRKAIAGLQLAGDDCFGARKDHLIVQRAAWPHGDPDRTHRCT